MTKNSTNFNDEIDLKKLFTTLWDGKLIIIISLLLSLVIGISLSINKKSLFQSKIFFSVLNQPPFYLKDKVNDDFQKYFYSKNIFDSWKKISSYELSYTDFSKDMIIDGFKYTRKINDQIIRIEKSEDLPEVTYFILDTNNLSLLNDFYSYILYVNEQITLEYYQIAIDELDLLDSRLNELTDIDIKFNYDVEELDKLSVDDLIKFNIKDKLLTLDNDLIKSVLFLDRFIKAIDDNKKIFAIQPPTYPDKIVPKTNPTISISLILGFLFGVFIVIIIKFIRSIKK